MLRISSRPDPKLSQATEIRRGVSPVAWGGKSFASLDFRPAHPRTFSLGADGSRLRQETERFTPLLRRPLAPRGRVSS